MTPTAVTKNDTPYKVCRFGVASYGVACLLGTVVLAALQLFFPHEWATNMWAIGVTVAVLIGVGVLSVWRPQAPPRHLGPSRVWLSVCRGFSGLLLSLMLLAIGIVGFGIQAFKRSATALMLPTVLGILALGIIFVPWFGWRLIVPRFLRSGAWMLPKLLACLWKVLRNG